MLPTFRALQAIQYELARKARFWKPKFNQAVPHYMQPQLRDPFDYPLRGKEEIQKQLEQDPPTFDYGVEIVHYNDTNGIRQELNRTVKMIVDINQMKLFPKQKERLVFLLGNRYKGDDVLKIKVEMYLDQEHNIEKGVEMVNEMYIEALRAPCE